MKLEQFHPDIISTEDINRLLEQRFGMQIDVDSISPEDRTMFLEALRKANESVNEKVNPEMKRIYQLLLKYGNNAKDAADMIKKNLKYVNKTFLCHSI